MTSIQYNTNGEINTNMNMNNSSNNISTTPTRLVSFYPHVKFKDCEYLGDGPYNKRYQVCDCCGEYKKIYILNKPVYYRKGASRKFVSYCRDCYDNHIMKGGRLTIADYKDFGYFEILDAIKDGDTDSDSSSSSSSGTAGISFDEAVTRAYNRTENISYNGSGAEPGVSMLKRYLGGRRVTDNNLSLNDKRLWEFRYKLQHEEPRVKVVKSSEDDDTLLLSWNKDYVEEVGLY